MSPYIYQPKGRAREYCDWALNLFKGCTHGCVYCFAPDATFADREAFHSTAIPRIDIFSSLEKEAKKFKGQEVFLSFTCDPYPLDDSQLMARQAIKILHAAGVKVRILTKGGYRSERDFDLLAARPDLSSYGATLTFIDGIKSAEWEPGAAPPLERMEAIVHAHELGIETWGSFEPVINTEETLHLIEVMAPYLDMFKVGMLNHDKTGTAKCIDWKKFGREAVDLLESLGKQYYIKKDLALHIN